MQILSSRHPFIRCQPASFGFHPALDILAIGYDLPAAGCTWDFHSLEGAPCSAHYRGCIESDAAPSACFMIKIVIAKKSKAILNYDCSYNQLLLNWDYAIILLARRAGESHVKARFKPCDQHQPMLPPPDLSDLIPEGHMVRVVARSSNPLTPPSSTPSIREAARAPTTRR